MKIVWANVFAYMRIVIASYVVEGGARVRNCERMHEISMRWVRSVKLLSRYCSSHSLEFVCHWNVKSSKRNFTFSSLKKKCFCGYVSIMRKVFLKFHMRNENFTQLTKVISYKVHFIAEHHYHHHRRRLFCLHLTILWGLLRAAAVATECYDEMESY